MICKDGLQWEIKQNDSLIFAMRFDEKDNCLYLPAVNSKSNICDLCANNDCICTSVRIDLAQVTKSPVSVRFIQYEKGTREL